VSAEFALAETRDEIAATWPIMRQLRPHLEAETYLALVGRLQAERDFRLARMAVDGEVVAVAGLRLGEWLHGGRYLEIEDFVTSEDCRSKGHGSALSTGSRRSRAARGADICGSPRASSAKRRIGSIGARA
jgi:GNAT superfamily N-acetyltransferase